MVPDFIPLYSVVIVLFALIYFSFASIPFLFVRLDVPEVARLFRGLFNAYFWMVTVTGVVATVAFAASGRMPFMIGMLLLAVCAFVARSRILQHIDAQQDACRAGDDMAPWRLRMLHWGSMAANILVVASIASTLPRIL